MNSFLLDGPLMSTFERRKAMIDRMAKDLVADGHGLLTDRQAKAALSAQGYNRIDVEILAGEARMVAFQNVVAREMSETDMDNTT